MYLFKNKDIIEVPIKCKFCLKEIKFPITVKEYQDIMKFPIKRESVHGEPEHKLTVFINMNLEIENFEIQDLEEKGAEEVVYSEELIKQVLGEIDLTDEEIELYFRTTGRETVSLGEISILIGKSKEECKEIVDKFIEKGLFKEIIGATPHYAALPPYAALVAQLRNFSTYISDIKSKIPTQLDKSFAQLESQAKSMENLKDSSEAMTELKEKMLNQIQAQKKEFDETITAIDQIKNITKDISGLGEVTKSISEDQIGNLTSQFENLNQKTSQIIKNQVSELRDQFGDVKKIVTDNLQKLRLGVIQQAVGDIIEKVISSRLKDINDNLNVQLSVSQTVFASELKKLTQGVDSEFVAKLRSSIEDAVKNIEGISIKTDDEKEKDFSEIIENFDRAAQMAEERIDGISGDIFKSFGNVREIFSKGIVDTLDNTLNDILNRLELSEKTTREFWEQSKKAKGAITMKDIWFIRSPEAAKAHINDEISKAKMRVLIVAPDLLDIDLDAIKARPSRINFRIATHINPGIAEHEARLQILDQMDNVDYRNRALQNLWGINKDYEEVILCVLSKIEFRGETITEIAGIGSIIEEHIKIFVPILEDAWVSSRKEIMRSIKSTLAKEPTPAPEPVRIKEKPLTIPPEPEITDKDVHETPARSTLAIQFDGILNNVENKSCLEISASLEKFQSEFVKLKGYNSALKNIHTKCNELKGKSEKLDQLEKEKLKGQMKIWRQQLNL
jgi:DNA-binding Lrp family transcriptional regulator